MSLNPYINRDRYIEHLNVTKEDYNTIFKDGFPAASITVCFVRCSNIKNVFFDSNQKVCACRNTFSVSTDRNERKASSILKIQGKLLL